MKTIQILSTALLLMFLTGWAFCSDTDTQADSQVLNQALERLDNKAFDSPRRPRALFNHDEHIVITDDNCAGCHHVYENGKPIADESSEDSSCSDCHGLKAGPDNKMDNKIPLEAAYHNLCKNCHITEGKGPVLCGECHLVTGK